VVFNAKKTNLFEGDMKNFESIGDRLRESIRNAGLTQKEVSEKGVISKSHLQYVLNDERDITVKKLLTLSHVLGIDLYWLLTGKTAEDVVKQKYDALR